MESTLVSPTKLSVIYNELIRQVAERLSEIRRIEAISSEFKYLIHHLDEYVSHPDDMLHDWAIASAFVGSNVLDEEKIQFNQLDSECYQNLERTWLHEIKNIRAYFISLLENNTSDIGNYIKACDNMNVQLLAKEPLPIATFSKVREYIEDKYLTKGSFDQTKDKVISEIETRANMIWRGNKAASSIDNWLNAEAYLSEFYENIIPAITDNSLNHITKVFNSFHKGNIVDPYGIVSCFEVMLMMNFLDKNKIKEALNIGKISSVI
jgi:hypothetical protein